MAKGLGGVGGGDSRTDAGWIQSSTIAQAAMVAVAIEETAAAKSMSDKQLKLQRDYYDLAKELREYWKSVYMPCERATVQAICAEKPYELQYDRTAGRYAAAVRQAFSKKWDELRCIGGRYCVGLTSAMMKDIALQEAIAVSDATNFAYRVEEDRKDKKDDVQWARKMEALAMGRDLNKTAITAAGAASDIAGNLSRQAGESAAGAMNAAGYLMGRKFQEPPANPGYHTSQFSAAAVTTPHHNRSVPIPTPKPEYSATRSSVTVPSNFVLDSVGKAFGQFFSRGISEFPGFGSLNQSANTAGNGGSSGGSN